MGLTLKRIDDPRDNLERARRLELLAFARANKVADVTDAMPAMLIRKRLRSMGLTQIAIPQRVLGQPELKNASAPMGAQPAPSEQVPEVDADADLERQFAGREKPVAEMTYNELKDEMKRRGIKRARTDGIEDFRRKLGG